MYYNRHFASVLPDGVEIERCITMVFQLPSFVTPFDLYCQPNNPTLGPPDAAGVMGQKYWKANGAYFSLLAEDNTFAAIMWRFPIDALNAFFGNQPMVGSIIAYRDFWGNTWYYVISWWDYANDGFSNAYVECLTTQCNSDGTVPDIAR